MPTPEQKTQLAICEWLSKQHQEVFEHIVKIDNEGKRSVGGHVLSKRMGLHKGASDLFIAWPTEKYAGLWVEIKPDKWRGAFGVKAKLHLENQMKFIDKMNKRGYLAKLVVGTDQGIDAIKSYLSEK